MTPERWRQIQDLFHELLELPEAERDAVLGRACAGDAPLRRQVLAMLEADAAANRGDAAEAAIVQTLEEIEARQIEAWPIENRPPEDQPPEDQESDGSFFRDKRGLRFGAYRVLQTLGRGGMGTVYLAERDDGQFRQQVAVKRVRAGLADEHTARRMRQERQILATLEHPAIARLIDGGVASDGRPYFVMEYVEGWPLDVYCDDRKLSIPERIGLFLEVCAAVHHAHQNLVLHRDVKPANVLVTAEGAPKLLDFGIAKLLDAEAPVTRAETAVGVRLLTPEFASPEQIRGEVLGTASDVYSLGVVLYLLLTGEMPYRRLPAAHADWQQAVSESRPGRPSDVALRSSPGFKETALERASLRGDRPERLARLLRGDLDTIVLTALRKEPERRYASVEQLAEDLRRHLEQRPIRARPESVTYRVGKFVSRHRWLVAASFSLLVTLVTGIVATTWQARRADRALQEARIQQQFAQSQQQRAEQAVELMLEVFEQADPAVAGGSEVTVREVLDRFSAAISSRFGGRDGFDEHGSDEHGSDEHRFDHQRFDLGADPRRDRALLLDTLGRVYLSLGRPSKAERALEESLRIYRHVLEPSDPLLGEPLEHLAEVRYVQGRFAAAEALQNEALALRLHAYGEHDMRVGISLSDLALLANEQGESELARERIERSLAALRASVGEEHAEYARALANQGVISFHRDDVAGAEEQLTAALAIRRKELGDVHPDTLANASNLAAVLEVAKKPEAAESLIRESLGRQIEVLGEEHPRVASSQHNLAAMLARRERLEEAGALYLRALSTQLRLLGDDHPAPALLLRNLGDLRVRQGRRQEAVDRYRDALGRLRRAASAPKEMAITAVRLAKQLAEAQPTEAKALYLEVLALSDFTPEIEDPAQGVERSGLWLELGRLALREGRLLEAEGWHRQSRDRRLEKEGAESRRTAEASVALAGVLAIQGRKDEALTELEEALPILESVLAPEEPPLQEALALRHQLADDGFKR